MTRCGYGESDAYRRKDAASTIARMPTVMASGRTTGQSAIQASIAPARTASRVVASEHSAERRPESAAHSATTEVRTRVFPVEFCGCCSPSGGTSGVRPIRHSTVKACKASLSSFLAGGPSTPCETFPVPLPRTWQLSVRVENRLRGNLLLEVVLVCGRVKVMLNRDDRPASEPRSRQRARKLVGEFRLA